MALSIFQKVIGPLEPADCDEPHGVADAQPGAAQIDAGSPPCPGRNGLPFERLSSAVAELGIFFRSRRGAVSVETVLTVTMMTFLCGGLMAIAHTAYSQDRMDRAARAAARAVALLPPGVATNQAAVDTAVCDVLRVEFDLNNQSNCHAIWNISIETGLTTAALADGTSQASTPANGTPSQAIGEMILIRVGSGQAVIRREPAG